MDLRWLLAATVLTALLALSSCQDDLEWIPMGDGQEVLPPGDDASMEVVTPIGFYFGGTLQHLIYVTTNGLISFRTPWNSFFNVPFPSSLTNFFLIAPFWDDANTNNGGTISYEIHTSGDALEMVSDFVSVQTISNFEGYWMMVILWDQVPPFSFFTTGVNTFQAILITDAQQNTYAVFIYQCGLMQWDNGATIGYNAGPDHFDNHHPSTSDIACVNYPNSNFSNVFYTLHEAEPLPTVPAQNSYLDFLPRTTTTTSSGYLPGCDECSSQAISLPWDFPFGNYYHSFAFVASNGHISFRTDYTHFNSEPFPTSNPAIYWDFVAAPFWSDIDTRVEGTASWEIHTAAQSPDLIQQVSDFIRQNSSTPDFSGDWMMIAYWEDVHPFPHGLGFLTPFTLSSNTFQAILITNGTKSYAVYTYRCGEMEWGDESTIGFNAGADYYGNHVLTGHFQSHFIACLQNTSAGSNITNVIYDLVPDPDSLQRGAIPPVHDSIGSCAAAGFTQCCTGGDCRGLPLLGDCYCDSLCETRGDCCYDEQHICPTGLLTNDYLIVADNSAILHMSLNGTAIEPLYTDINGGAYGIDYHLANGLMVWSDVERNIIYKKNLNGTGLVTELVTTNIAAVDDVAIDWIGNNLYWTDAVWARIEVLNLATGDRAEVLTTGANTNPRAIAVDPSTRFMYWTELGESVMIERASMDGTARQLLFGFGLIQPNGLTIDIAEQRLYWCDTALNTIVYVDVTSSGVQNLVQLTLQDGAIIQPFSVSLSGTSVFWTDWSTNSIHATHKVHGDDTEGHFATVYTSSETPRGIEVVSSDQQPTDITNPCEGSGCSHICMLSTNTNGFTCACPENYELNINGLDCDEVSTPSPTTPPEGSCVEAGYTTCCMHGSCGGSPATCFCDEGCYERFDCCSDVQDICNIVPPVPAQDISVIFEARSARVSFTIPFVVFDTEEYEIHYGPSGALEMSSAGTTSEDVTEMQYTIVISGLLPYTTYYFQLSATNTIGTTLSGIFSGTTLEEAPNGPPQSFNVLVNGTTLSASWEPPLPEDRNGVIISYTLSCVTGDTDEDLSLDLNPVFAIILYDLSPQTQYNCQISAATSVGSGPATDSISATTSESEDAPPILRWIPMGTLLGGNQAFLPATDDGFVGPIVVSAGFPFGSSVQTQVFVGTNGLISFGTGYNGFSNQVFPGNVVIQSRFLVAPFWDDVDIRFDTGDISYEIHQSGYFLDQVNAFIRRARLTDFEGTWMMVVFYDAVHPFFGLSNPEENTFQAILITDGTYSYTIFIYQCGLMGWDNGATIGFNAAGEMFANHDPSTSEVACLNIPSTPWSNVIFRLSANSSEAPPPSNVEAVDITLNSTTIQWSVTLVTEEQQYTVLYGIDPSDLGNSSDPVSSGVGQELTFEVLLNGLLQGTTYYVRVVAELGDYTIMSDVISFTTLEPAIGSPPLDFAAVALGTSITFTWNDPIVDEVLASYRISCNDGVLDIEVKPINEITLYDLAPEMTYFCSLSAASSGGYGPASEVINVTTGDAIEADTYFSFIPMDIHLNFEQLFFPGTDEGYAGPFEIPGGFPFGDTVQNDVYIGSNGILSFGSPYNPFLNQDLPVPDVYIVAPYWDDIDTRFGSGQISIEFHDSGYFLEEVSEFIRRRRSTLSFTGTWMLIVYWDAVHPYFGAFSPEENTFQAIVITDGTYSYSLFTYNCALMEWDNGVTIGFSGGDDFFHMFNPSTSEVACLNLPHSNFSNVVYRLSSASPEIPPPENVEVTNISMTEATIAWDIPSFTVQEEYVVEYGLSATNLNLVSSIVQSISDNTINYQPYQVTLQGLMGSTQYFFRVLAEFGVGDIYHRSTNIFSFFTQFEPQNVYLPFLPPTGTNIDSDMLLSCDDCSSLEITFPSNFPFGGYIHQSAYVSTNGIITFGRFLLNSEPDILPPTGPDTFWTYMVAPFWADFDTTLGGTISWEIHSSTNSSGLVGQVDTFLQGEYGDQTFQGSWMLVATWQNVQPSEQNAGNTFQAILITNGTKSYAVFTYQCGSLSWTDAATIGYNAPTTAAFTHPLSTTVAGATIRADEIACLHESSVWSNLIYELEDGNHILGMTPEPNFGTGSCVDAGHTECCTGLQCSVGSCFCDAICHIFGDCCYDIDEICPDSGADVYILVAHGHHISQIHFEGTSSETVRTNTSGTVVGIDYIYSESQMFWSDITTDTIHRANLDGSEEEVLVDSCISNVDDIAVDWVSNKLYWADSIWARIEALDLNTNIRVEVLSAGANTQPRAIAVDPINRAMFWTDYGLTAKIETAAMDGSERRVLHFTGLTQPNGITVDHASGRIYWSDSEEDRLEYSSFDGSDRNVVESETSGLLHPFAVTVGNNILFWSDWATNKVYATHFQHGTQTDEGYFAEIATFVDTPYGIEALREDRQPAATNPCLASECSHMCLMTFTNDAGYSCACPEGYEFENENDTFCKAQAGPPSSCSVTSGSCSAAAYSSCCEGGFCAGYPATCFCDDDCRPRGDCCNDINDTCIEGWPRLPRDISIEFDGTTATISWLVPFIASTPETYNIRYGYSSDSLDFPTDRILSGNDTSIINQHYSIAIEELFFVTTYYFRITVMNEVGAANSDILPFTTGEGAPSAPPSNVSASVMDTAVCLSWDPPPIDQQNGVIVSYLVNCTGTDYTLSHLLKEDADNFCIDTFVGGETVYCQVLASTAVGAGPSAIVTVETEGVFRGTLRFIPLNVSFGVETVFLPESDDGTFGPIDLPENGFPFWSSDRTSAYVAVNGLISFDQPYGSFVNQPFPGSFFISSRYLVAPFWDDANINGGRGQIYYEVHESGYFLDLVSAYLRMQRPSEFQGTWMLVVFYDAVQPFSSFATGENTYQAIFITDGTYTYTIFTYDCNLMGWGTSATIGFNAAGEEFINNEYTSNAIACSNLPTSNITNIIYRLSQNNGEYALPRDIIATDIQQTTVTVCWTVPSVTEQQQYTVTYGTDPADLNQMSGTVTGNADVTLTDQQYCVTLSGLQQSTLYHFKINITFGGLTIMTELSTFRTLEDPPSVPPENFMPVVTGVSVILMWDPPDVGTGVIISYNLSCSVGDNEVLRALLKPRQEFLLEELTPDTSYECSLAGATSGGEGPSATISFDTEDISTRGFQLPYVVMDSLFGVQQTIFPESDEGVNGPFPLDIGFPFGSSNQEQVYVGINGLISFGSLYGSWINQPFPGNAAINSRYLVAPFWDDVDTRGDNGEVSYEVHQSGYYLNTVNLFLRRNRPSSFTGTWMMVAQWNAVHPYFGRFNPEENTFQAILITDGVYSYTIFTYRCGLMEWGTTATIGYNAAGESFANNDPSSLTVACLNQPYSNYSNVIYLLSNESPEIPPPQDITINDVTLNSAVVSWRIPSFIEEEEYYIEYGTYPDDLTQRTDSLTSPGDTTITNMIYSITLSELESGIVYHIRVVAVFGDEFVRYTESIFLTREPEQTQYIMYLPLSSARTTLGQCDDCTSAEITFPSDFPFGGYFHQSAYVSTNGLISFGRPITNSNPELFPSDTAIIGESYILAPFWADFSTEAGGSVSWWIEEASDSLSNSIGFVSNFIRNEYGDDDFSATWMLVAFWDDLPPGNTFQAILLTNGSKSYAVYTYMCGDLPWSGPATVGLNTPDDIRVNHQLSLTPLVADIGCVHSESEWNNVIYELETNVVILPETPEPPQFLGSCVAAGFSDCCTLPFFLCRGAPNDCYCDTGCLLFGDCCPDFYDICDAGVGDTSFNILVGHGHHISQVHFEGQATETVRTDTTGTVVGVDYFDSQSKMFWSDITTNTIHRANMDGTEEEVLASTNLISVDDIAVDWVSGKLYWTDAGWARIEAMDLESLIRVELIRTGTNTIPRAIAVDPTRRVMYWTDWGRTAKIEVASMDGAERRDFVITELSQPNGISIDLVSERVYWCDSDLNRLEFIDFHGDSRTAVETEATGLQHPFAVSVSESILFWSDWDTNSIYATHKEHGADDGNGYFATIATFASTPYGVEALIADRQLPAENPCEDNECSHVCLLSEVAPQNFVCACPLGYILDNDTFCKVTGDTATPTPPPAGTCGAADYEYCCEHGFCAGYPATCFCDSDCFLREDCCSDIDSICIPGTPRAPTDVSVSNVMETSALISWTIPFITSSPETYYVIYGLAPDALTLQSSPLFSGPNVTRAYSQILTCAGLDPAETYYFRVIASNDVGPTGSDIYDFVTLSGPPSGPPLDFAVEIDMTAMAFSWSPPDPMFQNGEIISYTLSCVANRDQRITSVTTTQPQFTLDTFVPGEIFRCSVYATNPFGDGPEAQLTLSTLNVPAGTRAYLPLVPLGENQVPLPGSDDGVFGPIPLPQSGFPFWSTNRSTVYVANNGLLSFDSPYGSFSNRPFPSTLSSRYLVAPFWDDADTRFDSGLVSFVIYESGYVLDYVSAFLRRTNPSNFQGTWMMITLWEAIHPFPAFFTSEENTFQAILITDGSYTYTIFTYDCNFLEWGSGSTIGFLAGEETFENNPFTSNAIACSSLPDSNVTNVVYRLSSASPEFPPPQDVGVTQLTLTTATISWVVPYVPEWQLYSLVYGVLPDALNQSWGLMFSPPDLSFLNQEYSVTIQGLTQGTQYHLRVSSTFGYSIIYSDLVPFLTLEPPPTGPPLNFSISVIGTTLELSWDQPAEALRMGVIRYYTLTCIYQQDTDIFNLIAVPGIALDDFRININYVCTLSASTSGGPGPIATAFATTDTDVENVYLPLIPVGDVTTTNTVQLPESDDGVSDAITTPPFPFGDSVQTTVFVGTNGILSFNSSFNSYFNSPFPLSFTEAYLVAPFWDDVDIRGGNGRIMYEIHEDGYFLEQVNRFLQRKRPSSFEGTWMLVAHWDEVHPYFGATATTDNTFQAILITDGQYSYTIFTYKCGLMEWDNGAIIGFNAIGGVFENHDPSSSEVACLNSPESEYSNIVYLLSNESPEIPIPDTITTSPTTNSATVIWRIPSFTKPEEYYIQFGTDPDNLHQRTELIPSVQDQTATNVTYDDELTELEQGTIYYLRVVAVFDVLFKRESEVVVFRTLEEEQGYYLEFLEHSGMAGVVTPCSDGCSSSEITLPYDFPFRGYFHQTAFVGTNGIITFGAPVEDQDPEIFPLSFWSYLVAPLWININTTAGGSVQWEIFDNSNHSEFLDWVEDLLRQERDDNDFNGLWMLVATWQFTTQLDNVSNTLQAILITNGTKSYSIFTYNCDQLQWSGPTVMGYNAPPNTFYNHPITLSPLPITDLACTHAESVWNNIILDLQPGNVILPTTPQPALSGSCRDAGYTECCSFPDSCIGTPIGNPPCFCDALCVLFEDCCFDADHTCNAPTFDLLVGNGDHLSSIHFEGTVSETVRSTSAGNVVGVDFHAARSLMFWSDTEMHTIHRANLDGQNETTLVNTSIRAVDDIAVDWIANNLYWVDSVWARIEALNLDSLERAEIIRVGANTRPRAIAVDPINTIMFWTDWGLTAKIERAFMDGDERHTIHDTGLSQPNGITIDYSTQRIYWTDSDLDKIEYSNYDGTNRMLLETEEDGLFHPFALSIADEILFWTDWETNYLYFTHKDHGNTAGQGLFQPLAHFTSTPYGVEALSASRQTAAINPCENNECSHICLLSAANNAGFVCGCGVGSDIQNDDKTCSTPIPQPEEGSCMEAGYGSCCSHGYCAGSPATCSCNTDCHDLGDCCSDINDVCPAVPPAAVSEGELIHLTHKTAIIQWTVPTIVFSPELYTFMYSITEDDVNTMTIGPFFSGTDISQTNQMYTVTLEGLSPTTTYYYQIKAENTFGMTLSDIFTFETPYLGAPQNFIISVEGSETLTFSWDLPLGVEQEEINYFLIDCEPTFQHDISEIVLSGLSATLEEFLPGTTYTCTVQAKADELGAPATQTATTEEAPTNLPFLVLGATEGVETITLPPSDDATSDPIYIIGGLPLGSATHTVAHVGTNGIISFGQDFLFWNPEAFPTSNYFIHTSYVTAPFWADMDTRLEGSVFYETHQRGTNPGSDAVLERLSGFISSELGVEFTGSWMLVAQWDRVHPFPHVAGPAVSEEYGNFLESENTFQGVVITDGTQSFVMFTYQCDLMGWSGVDVGSYAIVGFNLNGVYENHPLSGTSEIKDIGCLSTGSISNITRRQSSNWHNQLYQLPTVVDPIQQLRSECLAMQILDIQTVGDIQSLSSSLGACPPSASQAFLDFRFLFHSESSTFTSRCYTYVFSAGAGGLSSLICCYALQSSVAGALLTGGPQGSSISLYHPTHFTDEHDMYDKEFREKCCSSGLCDVFHGRRPIDNSINYVPPFFGWGNGDPHIRTLDGTTYTFNGRGEYTLIEILNSGFALQGRTEPVSNTSNATQFSAFTMGIRVEGLSAEVQLYRGRLIAFINSEDISTEIETVNSTTTGGGNAFYLIRTGPDTIRMLLYREGIAYLLTVTQREDILDFVINLDPSVMGHTRGLFGNFNGDGTDDFIRPNGIVVPSDASDQMLHDYGQSWQITEQKSMFTYPSGMSHSDFYFPDHIAPLLSDVVASAPSDIIEMCNNNEQCIFDAIQTNNPEIGVGTLDSITNNDNDVMVANNFPPTVTGPATLRVNIGQVSVYTFTATDDDTVQVTVEGPEGYTLTENGNSYTFSWTPSQVFSHSIMFVAVDLMGLAATLTLRVKICACQNGECTLDGILSTDSDTIDMLCECEPGWEGRYCGGDQDGCSALTCFEGVQCFDVAAPASGAICGSCNCPLGYQRDGEKCADVDECNSMSIASGCEQVCLNSPGSYMCGCRDGYELTSTTECTDINECQLQIHNCEQECTNRDGSFTCSCRNGYRLNSDGITCEVIVPCVGDSLSCEEECVVIDGDATCTCPNGFQLDSDGRSCSDIKECEGSVQVCADKCIDTEGSFVCECSTPGYTLSPNQRDCIDIDECIASALTGFSACPEGEVCINNDGSFVCECPTGTTNSSGICKAVNVTQPPVVTIPTPMPTDKPDETGRKNSVNVTLRISKEMFDVNAQFKFKIDVVCAVTKYCAENTGECRVDQVLIDPSDVIILDEIVNDANGRATFLVFVYLKNPTDVLSGKILQIIVADLDLVATVLVAPVVGETDDGGSSGGGLSGGGVAGIVILLIVVMVVVAVAVIILYHMQKSGPKIKIITNLTSRPGDIFRFRPARSSMLLEEDVESMKETVSIGGDVSEAKAKEAVMESEQEEEPIEAPGEEVKIDIAEETV